MSLKTCKEEYPEPRVHIPTAFTPNGDGLNDTWEIAGLPEDNEVVIFTRWGNLVFQKKNYTGNWDGTDLDGNPVPEGVYVYRLHYTYPPGITKKEHGWVQVIHRE